jgi:TonB-linked SusC/RagA family outer membrane protein
MRSYFARGTYNYDSKYYLTATWRADGSSKFGQNNKFGYFPSFGLGWRVSEESFLKGTEIFENFKLRGGWGITGSQAVGSYKTFSPMDGGNSWNGHMYGTSTTYVGQRVGLAGNPNLQWEQTEQSNIGADVSVLKGKLSGTIDYYMKNTSKLLTSKTMPGMVGGGRTLVNLGSIENKGFEIGINYIVLDHQDLKYDLGFNYSRNRNKIKDIGEEKKLWGDTYASGILALSPFVMMPGYALGTIYGYEYLGIWQTADATEAAKFGQSPGDYRYEDLNGDKSYGSEDYQVIGDCNPKYTWGFTNHITYKNIDFSFLIEGVQGRDVLNMSYALATNSIDISRAVSLRKARERWSESNPGAEFAKIGTTNKMQLNSSQFVQDGSFVKLRNVSIGYRLPQTMTKIGDIQFNVSAQNVLCFTKYKGYDPEVSSSGSSDSSSGSDFFAYPNARSVTFSVSLVF